MSLKKVLILISIVASIFSVSVLSKTNSNANNDNSIENSQLSSDNFYSSHEIISSISNTSAMLKENKNLSSNEISEAIKDLKTLCAIIQQRAGQHKISNEEKGLVAEILINDCSMKSFSF